jgi:hypothetical protein
MKKIIVGLLVCVSVLLSSCEANDPERRLSGKTYRYKYDSRDLLFWGVEETYKFYASGRVSYESDGYQKKSWGIDHDFLDYKIDKQYLKYEVQGENVYVFWDSDDNEAFSSGVIKGNTIHMQMSEEGSKVKIYELLD